MAPLFAKRTTLLALVFGAIGLFVLVDLPQTVRIKALIINSLPLADQTKHDVVENLCSAASMGSPDPSSSRHYCEVANDITLAENLRAFTDRLSQIIMGTPSQTERPGICALNDSGDERTCVHLDTGIETRENKTATGDWKLVEERSFSQRPSH